MYNFALFISIISMCYIFICYNFDFISEFKTFISEINKVSLHLYLLVFKHSNF